VSVVPEWLRPAFPDGYTEETLGHMLCLYFEARPPDAERGPWAVAVGSIRLSLIFDLARNGP
jgi:hypothetical protein